jgi:glucose-6-phosphate 1-dehydrogenase
VLDWRLSAKTRAIITSHREHLRRFAHSSSDWLSSIEITKTKRSKGSSKRIVAMGSFSADVADPTLFAAHDYVEEAWRIVDPVLKAGTPIFEYEKGAWGPSEVEQRVSPAGGWHDPITSDQEDFRLVAKAG